MTRKDKVQDSKFNVQRVKFNVQRGLIMITDDA